MIIPLRAMCMCSRSRMCRRRNRVSCRNAPLCRRGDDRHGLACRRQRIRIRYCCRTIACRRCRSPGSRDVRRVGRMGDSVRMSWWGWQRPCSWRGRHRCVAGVREREGWHLRCLRRGGLGTDHRGRYRGARASVGEAVGIVFDHESDCNCTCGADAVESQRDIPQ